MPAVVRGVKSPHQVQIILRGSCFYFLNDAGGSWPVVEAIEHALTDVATSCPLLESQAKTSDQPRTPPSINLVCPVAQ